MGVFSRFRDRARRYLWFRGPYERCTPLERWAAGVGPPPLDCDPHQPPWILYPHADPWWGGFRQGNAEAWFTKVWKPYWVSLNDASRAKYLENWPPPNADWAEYLNEYWRQGHR